MNRLENRIVGLLENWKKKRQADIQSITEKREMRSQIDNEIDLIYSERANHTVSPEVFGEMAQLYLTLSQEILEILEQNKPRR